MRSENLTHTWKVEKHIGLIVYGSQKRMDCRWKKVISRQPRTVRKISYGLLHNCGEESNIAQSHIGNYAESLASGLQGIGQGCCTSGAV
jgi:hypothetical protein